jgi:hypothetical protein
MVPRVALLVLLASPAAAQDGGDRHLFELGIGGGLALISDDPAALDVQAGGQLDARLMLDVDHARFDARAVLPDPTRPEEWWVRADGRLLFITVRDFTWRDTPHADLLRFYGGVGGEVELPEGVGHLMIDAGAAVLHLQRQAQPLSEAYGAYAGFTLRLSFWEIRDELRFAVHGITAPPAIGPSFSIDSILNGLRAGVLLENRFYLQGLREGPLSLGPELVISYEDLLEGPELLVTLGVSGVLGL